MHTNFSNIPSEQPKYALDIIFYLSSDSSQGDHILQRPRHPQTDPITNMFWKLIWSVQAYLIFVIFFTQAKFLENKIYTEKCVNYDKLHSKLPILRVNYDKLHSKLPIFRVKSVKISPAKKIYTGAARGARDKYEVWMKIPREFCPIFKIILFVEGKQIQIVYWVTSSKWIKLPFGSKFYCLQTLTPFAWKDMEFVTKVFLG